MGKLLTTLHGSVDEEDEDEEGDSAERADNSDDSILTSLAIVRRGLSGPKTTICITGTAIGLWIRNRVERETSIDMRGKFLCCSNWYASVKRRVLVLHLLCQGIDHVRGDETEPHGTELNSVRRRPVSCRHVYLQHPRLDLIIADPKRSADDGREQSKDLRRGNLVVDDKGPVETLIEQDTDKRQSGCVDGVDVESISRINSVGYPSGQRGRHNSGRCRYGVYSGGCLIRIRQRWRGR